MLTSFLQPEGEEVSSSRVPDFVHQSDAQYQPDYENRTYYLGDNQVPFEKLPSKLQHYYALSEDMSRLMNAAKTADDRRWIAHVHPYFLLVNVNIKHFQQWFQQQQRS